MEIFKVSVDDLEKNKASSADSFNIFVSHPNYFVFEIEVKTTHSMKCLTCLQELLNLVSVKRKTYFIYLVFFTHGNIINLPVL